MDINLFEIVFLEALGIDTNKDIFYARYDKEELKLFGKCDLQQKNRIEFTDFYDGTSNTRVYTSTNYVLNVVKKENKKQTLKEIRVIKDNIIYTLKQTLVGYKLKEMTISAGEYGKSDQTIVKMRPRDKFQPNVFLKTYILRPEVSYAIPCYIDCTKQSSKLVDVGDIVGHYREEFVSGFYKTTSNDYLFLLKENIEESYLYPDNLKEFFKSMLPLFEMVYKHLLDKGYSQLKDETSDIDELHKKLDNYERRMQRRLKEELSKRLSDNELSEIEREDIRKQYEKWLNEFQQELQVEARTIDEISSMEDKIQHNK